MQTSQSALLFLHLMHLQSEFSESLHTFIIKECLFPTTYIPFLLEKRQSESSYTSNRVFFTNKNIMYKTWQTSDNW